jgi:hypothetical protein
MNKAKKLAELITPYDINPRPTSSSKGTTNDTLSALAKLIKYFTSGKSGHDVSRNPYTIPEIRDALKILAKEQGVKDHYDVDLDKFIKE